MSIISIAVHGGAGTILPSQMNPEKEAAYRKGLQDALDAGYLVLEKGGSALDAVEVAVKSLEDCPLFNAGRGAVFNAKGQHECDASIMCGKDLSAGAVAGVSGIKNPVSLAKAVMQKSEHVMLAGAGAEEFAKSIGTEFADEEYFYTQQRFEQWQEAKTERRVILDHTEMAEGKKFGTVGAVALDSEGNIAASTSTGGMTNKKFGRVGDTPIIGAGTYAENGVCGVSCTGHGEFFIRAVTAYHVACQMKYRGLQLLDACNETVLDKLLKMGGEGGLIALDSNGDEALVFNSEGMYRGFKSSNGKNYTAIYK